MLELGQWIKKWTEEWRGGSPAKADWERGQFVYLEFVAGKTEELIDASTPKLFYSSKSTWSFFGCSYSTTKYHISLRFNFS